MAKDDHTEEPPPRRVTDDDVAAEISAMVDFWQQQGKNQQRESTSDENPMSTKVIRVVGLIDGTRTAFDNQYVVEFDANRDGVEPGTNMPMMAYLATTPNRAEATRYSAKAAFELWRAVDQRNPVRPDGKPNRPLTAFTVDIEPADD